MTDNLKKLINKIKLLIKEDEKYNGDNDRWCWSAQYGILITTNEAKSIIKIITDIESKSND